MCIYVCVDVVRVWNSPGLGYIFRGFASYVRLNNDSSHPFADVHILMPAKCVYVLIDSKLGLAHCTHGARVSTEAFEGDRLEAWNK